jgi:DNA-nicking Smr family endonuclease
VAGEIGCQRRHRHIPLFNGMKVRALTCVGTGAGRTDPIHSATLRILSRYHGLGSMAMAEPDGPHAPDLLEWQIRHIDIEHQAFIERPRQQACNHGACHLRRAGKVMRTSGRRAQRQGNCRQSQEAPFQRRGDSTRIKHVITQIGSVVDTAHYHVELVLEQTRDTQMHAIGGSAHDAIQISLDFLYAQRHIERERIAGTAAIAIGCYRGDVAESAQGPAQLLQTLGAVAVIIAYEYLQGAPIYWIVAWQRVCRVNDRANNTRQPASAETKVADSALFRAAVTEARPLRTSQRVAPPTAKRVPRARMARAERAAVLAESLAEPGPFIETLPGDELKYRQPGIAEQTLRELRRGDYRVEAALDLHGMTGTEATGAISQFLTSALARGLKCVRVIHGKGMRSGPRGPVLKQTVNTLLRRTNYVLAFTSARDRDGGTGATLVLLSKRRGD